MKDKACFLTILFSFIFTGCIGFIDPHENFKEILGNDVGKPFDKAITHRQGYLGERTLSNGNHEHEFLVSTADCHVFMEVNPKTNIVVDWRFDAPDPYNDCYINP